MKCRRDRQHDVDQIDQNILREERAAEQRNVAEIRNRHRRKGGRRRHSGIGLADGRGQSGAHQRQRQTAEHLIGPENDSRAGEDHADDKADAERADQAECGIGRRGNDGDRR